jgi:hypothetical protein
LTAADFAEEAVAAAVWLDLELGYLWRFWSCLYFTGPSSMVCVEKRSLIRDDFCVFIFRLAVCRITIKKAWAKFLNGRSSCYERDKSPNKRKKKEGAGSEKKRLEKERREKHCCLNKT